MKFQKSIVLRFLSLLAIVFLTLATTACKEEKKFRIGVSQCSDDDWRKKMNEEINREILFHEDAEVEIISADDDPAKQAEDIRYFADSGFDIIIASPVEAEALTPVIKEVYDRGVPVILFDREINGDSYTAKITADNEGIGASAARYGLQMEGKPRKAIELRGLKGSTPATGRHEGFVREFTAGGGTVVAEDYGNWKMEESMPAAERLLREHPEADLIYAHNDRMAIGAAEAARKLGRNDIRIIGIDAAPSIGIKAVLDSVIDATFLYPPEGQRVVNTALNILKGKDFKRNEVLPATSAVDLTNADILQLQDETLAHETSKIRILKEQVDDYWSKHTVQTILFYTLLAFLLMIFVFLFLTLKAYWIRKKNQAILEDQNHELEKQRDLQKKLNEQLNEATQSKLMFFTNVSHDLRTPLTLIAEPVEQLQKAGNLTPQQQTLMKIADKNVKILKRLINQILDFRKYENGKLKLNLTETDLVECVREWIDAFRALARKRDIKIIVDLPDEPIQMAIDGEKFERVFFNLVSNAFKYTPDNGTIRLSLRKEGDKAIFRLSDTGEGISKEDLGHIFDRFFQVDRVRPKGSGIGLSLTKAFVELHDGTISVESEKGKGTEFTVTLKIRHVEGTEARKYESTITDEDVTAELENIVSTADISDESKPLVLVIDDNADMLRLISELMSDTYRIITAPDGKEGVRLAAKYVPDAVICDVMMPVMDGLECCRLIKDEVSTSHIPVLMLTACSMDEQKVQGFDSGADGYISKPFNSGVLRSNIDSLIANRRTIRNLWLSGNERISRRLTGDSDRQSPAKAPVASPAGDIDSDFYRRFLEIFEKEMGNADLNIEHIASQMGLGHSQFYRKIKALTNYTPVELMRRLRLEEARTLLTTEKAISEIAYEVGFSTPAYFTKCYRTAFGETPTELRERLGAR